MADTVTDAQPEKKKPTEQAKPGDSATTANHGDKMSSVGGTLLSTPDSRAGGEATQANRADLPDTKIVDGKSRPVSAADLADMNQFRTDLKTEDVASMQRSLQEKTGGFEIKPGREYPPTPDTIEFSNSDVSIADKIKTAMVEAKATGKAGFYINQQGDRLFVSADTNPADKLEDFQKRQERKAASGMDYTVKELPQGGVLTFPDGSDAAKVIPAAIAEAKGTRQGLTLSVNDAYMGQVTPHSDATALRQAYDQRTKEISQAVAQKESAKTESAKLQQQLGYTTEDGKNGAVDMTFPNGSVPPEKAIAAAITEATARGKRVSLDIDGHHLDITYGSNPARELESYENSVRARAAQAERGKTAPAGDLNQFGLGGTDASGERAETTAGIQQHMLTRLEHMHNRNELMDKARDPDALRRELGITENQLKQMAPADKAKLGEELKGRLAAYGMAADLLPNLVRYVLQTGG